MIKVRQSIINRHTRAPTLSNEESIDKEFQKELHSLEVKQMKYALKEAEVRQSVSPRRDEKLKRQEQMKQAMEEQVRLKEVARQKLRQEEITFDQYNHHIGKHFGPHSTVEERSREQHKREYLKGLMDENKRLSILKKELQEKEKELELEMDRIRVSTPSTWNRRHYL